MDKKMKVRIIIVFWVLLIFNTIGYTKPVEEKYLLSFQEAFVDIAKKVAPAVVRISTTKKIKVSREDPFGFFEFRIPEEFRKWFEEFGFDFDSFFFEPHPREYEREERGLGSGIIISEDGYILTNEHVVGDADEIKITLPSGLEFEAKGKDIRKDEMRDIAIIKIDTKGKKLPVAKLGNSDRLKVGQWAIAIGNPFAGMMTDEEGKIAQQPTITVGVISALNRSLKIKDKVYEDLIQTDASINPGNSGGPLVDIKGEVIGVNVAILAPISGNIGIGFAIPINRAKESMDVLIAGGAIERGYLGIQMQDVTEELAKEFGLKEKRGILVADVIKNSPAERAGIKRGDIILKYNDEEVNTQFKLRRLVLNTKPNTKVKIIVWRNKVEKLIVVTIGKLEKEINEKEMEKWRGITVKEIDEELVEKFRLDAKIKGVIIVDVEYGSVAHRIGLRKGDVIFEVKHQKVTTLKDFIDIVERVKEGETVLLSIIRKRYKMFVTLPPESGRR